MAAVTGVGAIGFAQFDGTILHEIEVIKILDGLVEPGDLIGVVNDMVRCRVELSVDLVWKYLVVRKRSAPITVLESSPMRT